MSGELQTFLLAMTPLGELRAALPMALIVYNLNWVLAFVIAVAGNIIPAVIIVFFLEPVSLWLSAKSKLWERLFTWLFERTRKKYGARLKRYGWLGLALFVAVPLPLTGAWTGALIAYHFKIPARKALFAIANGVFAAGIIVSVLVWSGVSIKVYFGWTALLGAALLFILIWLFVKIGKNK